jgi:ribulose-bisphosphate carboxylase large chain
MGRSSEALAEVAWTLAAGGIDIIKDDHSLASQPFAPYAERVRACAAAVRRANDETGGRSIYMPALNGPSDRLRDMARHARDAGAGGLLVLPGLVGMDVIRLLAESDEIALPVMAHPAFLGSLVVSEHAGIEHGLLFGTLMRLAGADLTVFPNYGGRFSFGTAACASIARASAAPLDGKPASVPAPGGGMTLARLDELMAFYGPDVALLIGGDLHRGDLLANVRRMRAAVDAAAGVVPVGSFASATGDDPPPVARP